MAINSVQPAELFPGLGTAMVHPALIASISDHAHPAWRAGALAPTGSGATSATQPAPSSPESSPTPSA